MNKDPLDKPALFDIQIKLSDELFLFEKVFNHDTPITICDRLLRQNVRLHGGKPVLLSTILSQKHHRKLLQAEIEKQVNTYI